MKSELPLPESAAVLVGRDIFASSQDVLCTCYMLHSAQSRSPFSLPDAAVSLPEFCGLFWQRAPVLVCATHLLRGASWDAHSRAHTMHGMVRGSIAPCCSNCHGWPAAASTWACLPCSCCILLPAFRFSSCTDSRLQPALLARPAWSDTFERLPAAKAWLQPGCGCKLCCVSGVQHHVKYRHQHNFPSYAQWQQLVCYSPF